MKPYMTAWEWIQFLQKFPPERVNRIATQAGLAILARGLSFEEAMAEAIENT